MPCPVSRAMTAAAATCGCAASRAWISPSWIRKPRIFTWSSLHPEELQCVVLAAAHQVSGAVHPAPGHAVERAEGVGDEPLGGQVGAAEVADGQAGTGDVQLTGHPGGHGTQGGVQDIGPRSTHGSAPGPVGGIAGQPVVGVDGRLGRAVEVDRVHAVGCGQPLPEGRGHGLAADDQMGGVVAPLVQQTFGDQRFGVGRGDIEIVDTMGTDVRGEDRGVPVGGVVQQVQLMAVDHPQQRVPGRVEGERRAVGDPEPLPAGAGDSGGDVVGEVAGAEVGQRGVADEDALGTPGGTGGVDEIGGVTGHGPGGGRAVRAGGQRVGRRRLVERDGGETVRRQRGQGLGRADDADGPGVLQDGQRPGGGVAEVQRLADEARLEHGEQRHHHVGGPGQGERHRGTGLRRDRESGQQMGQPVGHGVQLGEGEGGTGTGSGTGCSTRAGVSTGTGTGTCTRISGALRLPGPRSVPARVERTATAPGVSAACAVNAWGTVRAMAGWCGPPWPRAPGRR
ncbi:hypothetical protein SMICM304S_02167 [Streptomyces microflavus]